MGWDVSRDIQKRREFPSLSVMILRQWALRDPQPRRVPLSSSLGTLKPADVHIFLSVDTTGHLDPDKVLPCRHGEGSGKFFVEVSQPAGFVSSSTCESSASFLAEAAVLSGTAAPAH